MLTRKKEVIKGNELRIGNLVAYTRNGRPKVIDCIDLSFALPPNYTISLYKPFPLTEMWLERLGYELRVNLMWNSVYVHRSQPKLFPDLPSDWLSNKEFCCEYVHRWQNYCFFSSGRELTIDDQAKK